MAMSLDLTSPSHLFEINQFIYGGRRDWCKTPFRILVAGALFDSVLDMYSAARTLILALVVAIAGGGTGAKTIELAVN